MKKNSKMEKHIEMRKNNTVENSAMEEEAYRYWIGSIPNLRANKINAILEYFGSPKEVYNASICALEDMIKVSNMNGIAIMEGDLEATIKGRDMDLLIKNLEYLKNHGIKFVTMLDDSYPDKLRNIYDPPFLLYYKGNPLPDKKKIISIVGARECSIYGKETAKYLASALAREDITIISGLARGIDSYAHMGALSSEGITYGIMGCGIDICYPAENIKLYMDIQAKGGIISEYGPGIKPLAYHFPMRNRIISALSDGILVIEAKEKSGSLITVDMGLDQGKNIYAVPGRITDKLSKGCNNLIKMGAKVVTSPKDILEDFLEYFNSGDDQLKLTGILDSSEQAIYDILTLSPMHIEDIVSITGFDLGEIMEYLLSMELKDIISQPFKNYYTRRPV
ncbi:MAG: DNA-protecting protein DprA [Clostridiales bacterium]|jgi:DNA processing protein|nr:DNA-protecting protein DprA [Clostridiales bacterium]